jgi:5-carboxymethyl-2-hydroxymuconate isomerase
MLSHMAGTKAGLFPGGGIRSESRRVSGYFLGELPDKTMFASLVLATKGGRGLLRSVNVVTIRVVTAVIVGPVKQSWVPSYRGYRPGN